MKEAVGEANMTIFVLIAIGIIIGIFMFMAPQLQDWIQKTFIANTAINCDDMEGYKPNQDGTSCIPE